jgi:hypothetical protein
MQEFGVYGKPRVIDLRLSKTRKIRWQGEETQTLQLGRRNQAPVMTAKPPL